MRELLTDVLDVAGLLAVAVGVGMGAAVWWLPLGPLAGGLVLIGGVQLAVRGEQVGRIVRRFRRPRAGKGGRR